VPPQSGVANSVTTLAHRTTRYCQSRDPELALRPNRNIHFSVIAGLDPQLSGSAFCFSYTKAPKTPAQRWRSLAGLVPAIHVFERGPANGREGVDAHGSSQWAEGPRAKPGQGDLGLYRSRYKQSASLNRTSMGSTRPSTSRQLRPARPPWMPGLRPGMTIWSKLHHLNEPQH
jgi:hypothetical protein